LLQQVRFEVPERIGIGSGRLDLEFLGDKAHELVGRLEVGGEG
jgi:hypothetical protein